MTSITGPNGTAGPAGLSGDLYQLYQQVLSQTGSADAANRAVQTAQAIMDDAYHQTMISTKGDKTAANRARGAHRQNAIRLAGLVPQIQTEDPEVAGPALQEVMQMFGGDTAAVRERIYPWLRHNIGNDEVFTAAGLDPTEVRRNESAAWAQADVEPLLAFARDMLENYRLPNGDSLSSDQIDGYLTNAREAARRYGIGADRPVFVPPAETTADGETVEGAEGSENVEDSVPLSTLGLPIRL